MNIDDYLNDLQNNLDDQLSRFGVSDQPQGNMFSTEETEEKKFCPKCGFRFQNEDAALAQHPEFEQQNQEAEEPLFVKNLENVQGDERDVILFSVGYGPDKDGHLSMNFGPLNQIGGERRLNVAVSRARYEMKVFSTLLPEQIDERRTQAEGVLGLKQFMRYAQQGALKSAPSINSSEDSSLIVQQIAEALLRKGYEVKTNVGSSVLRVDLAIIDPLHKDHYTLGIVLDGANYYHLKTTCDREIVQPSVLQMLGWRLMHVWTIDWLSHPENVITEIVTKIK